MDLGRIRVSHLLMPCPALRAAGDRIPQMQGGLRALRRHRAELHGD